MSVQYQKLNLGDIAVGKPVPWPLYDENRKLLLARGVKLESERQLSALMERGLFRVIQGVSQAAPREEEKEDAGPREDIRKLEDIRLTVGDTLQMQSRAAGDESRYYVKLIGFLKGRGLIVTAPTAQGQLVMMREGQAFVVRLFAGKSVYAFATNVQRVTSVPFPHVFLEYPREVRGLVVRRGARAKVSIICSVANPKASTQAATVVDLSVGGAMILAKAPLGDRNAPIVISFKVEINGVEQLLKVPGFIRSVRTEAEDARGNRFHHGIEFSEMESATQVSLSGFVYQTLFEQSAEL
ncbi:MAG: flagellar brake protein [Rhodocyclaceae bacterium]|nr:flagellar brake protein [Rhodocyclaceae bacterium]